VILLPISYLKWAGGKFKVAHELLRMFTKTGRLSQEYWSVDSTQQYHEWFGGGLSMYFVLRKSGFIHHDAISHLNDFSEALINSARIIQTTSPKTIFDQLEKLRLEYIKSLGGKEIPRKEKAEVRNKRFYYLRRKEFNRINHTLITTGKLSKKSQLRLCSLMIFLNKTCFNGIYRVNKKGEMNVPEGDYPSLNALRTEEEIRTCANLLENSMLTSGDWRNAIPLVKRGDLVYIDPPYAKSTKGKGFTTYSTAEFTEQEQIDLAHQSCHLVRDKRCRVIASNHDTKWVQNVYREAAKVAGVEILFRHIKVARAVNSDGKGRKSVPELLMFIFPVNR
jgi:DNA adenine methylase